MASKQVVIDGVGEVTLYKRRSTASIRLSITPKGQVKVTMPYWVPYEAGVRFAKTKAGWIQDHLDKSGRPATLANGRLIGKMHRLVLEASPVADKVSSRVDHAVVRITYPAGMAADAPEVQAAAERAGVRALRQQAELLLPNRLKGLAMMHGFEYSGVQIKQLTGRWGSCDSHKNIVLNLYLMELPWPLIDYVLFHELAHTEVLRHGPDFWAAMKRVLPDTQVRRKAIKMYRPVIGQDI